MYKYLFFLVFCCAGFSLSANITKRLEEAITFSPDQVNKVGYIKIGMERPIDQSTFIQAKFAVEHFQKQGCIFVYLDLDTPGGEVFAAQKIAKLLQATSLQTNMPVVSLLNNWAVSAGAMLAYATPFIAITPSSIMGAAEPVIVKDSQMSTASEKVNSALRAEFMNLASVFNRNPDIAEAMVDKDVILVYRERKIIKLQNEKQIRPNDEIISNKGKLLTLNADTLQKYGVADIEVPFQKLVPITELEQKEKTWPASKTLLFQDPFFARIPHAQIITYTNWKIGFFSILSHPVVSSLLLMGMLIGFYLEVNTPGFGVFGSIALGCLGLILLNSFALQAIDWLEVILFFIGIALIAVEIFIIPGFGVIGILGIIFTIVGLFAMMLPSVKDITITSEQVSLTTLSALHSLIWLFSSVVIAFGCIFVLGRYFFIRLPFFRYIVSKGEQEGYISGLSKENLPQVGEEGVVYSSLRPSGKVMIQDTLFDASSERHYIEKGEKIVVSQIVGSRILVKRK